MQNIRLSVSTRRHMRREKARIRRTAGDEAEAKKKIHELITRIRAPRAS